MTHASLYERFGVALLAVALCMWVPLAARAQDSGTNAPREEVKDLKQVIQRLNERIDTLERQLAPGSERRAQGVAAAERPAPQPAASAPTTTSPRDHWRQISHGMTAPAVEALLGRPQRTMKVSLKTVWYYTYPDVGSGSVVFAEDGAVDDWQTPPFNTWW